jgi:mannose-6-phosphate isomerase
MPPLYPLRFEPILRRYIWGGRRLETVLGKRLGGGEDYAESWEICDHGADQSVVTAGPLAGTRLCDLVSQRGDELLGRNSPQARFPLLFKFIDAHKPLSVQVHPDDARAALLTPPDLGKTEAWVILAAEPGSLIYAGLKRGFDRQAFERELARGTCELCLHRFEPQIGDCLLLPAGMIHALGAGLVVAEIQQASDTTYRVFDWNRVGPDGKPRQLHLEQSLEAIDYGLGPAQPQVPQATAEPHVSRLAACDKFILDRWVFDSPKQVGGDDRCYLLAVLEGEVAVQGDAGDGPLGVGGTMLLPAAIGSVRLEPRGPATLLCAYLP